jgi:hypothetical protein
MKMSSDNVKRIDDVEQLTFEQMRIEFMRFSPTYQLIHDSQDAPTSVLQIYIEAMQAAMPINVRRGLFAAGAMKLQARQIRSLEGLYEDAEFAYLSYEDINMPYEKWWGRRGHLIFDSASNQAVIRDLGTIDIANIEESTKGVRGAVKQLAGDTSSRLHMLVTIPMFMPYKEATQQLSRLLKANLLGQSSQHRVRKQLHGKRHHNQPLLKKLKLLMYKCMYPDASLIELGIKANISPSNERILQGGNFSDEDKAAARRSIGLAASRALLAAEYIAERAARDKFPDARPTPSLGIDWKASKKNLLKAWPNLKG